jgi:hypothetical protein
MGVGGGPRQEFIDARRGPYELFKHVRAIGFGIGAVEAAGFDQGGKASPGFRAFIAPGE